MLTLGKVISKKREEKPDCQVVYHKLVQNPTMPKEFTVTVTHRVVFQLKERGSIGLLNSARGAATLN